MFTHAITRQPGPNVIHGLTTANLGRPDFTLMQSQHQAYVGTLKELGLSVIILPAEPDFPDACFVEDPAIVLPEVAVISRPGAPSRRGERASLEAVLAHLRPLARIEAPGTLEGGDVLVIGRAVFIGLSERTNRPGAEQLARILSRYGYHSTFIPLADGLHLKSSVNYVGKNSVLVTPDFAAHDAFSDYEKLVVAPADAYAANTLLLNEHLITPAGFPAVKAMLDSLGLPIIELDMSEARKLDGGLTCLSLRF